MKDLRQRQDLKWHQYDPDPEVKSVGSSSKYDESELKFGGDTAGNPLQEA